MTFYREEENEQTLYIQNEYEVGDMLLLSFKTPESKKYNQYMKQADRFAFVGIIMKKKHSMNGVPIYEIYFPSTGIVSESVILYSGITVELLYSAEYHRELNE